jgi:hypothetical protein
VLQQPDHLLNRHFYHYYVSPFLLARDKAIS